MSPRSTVCCRKNLSTRQQLVIKNQNQKKNVSKFTQKERKKRPRRPKGVKRHEDRRLAKEAVRDTMYKKVQTRLIMKKRKKLPAVLKEKALKKELPYAENVVVSVAVVTVAVEEEEVEEETEEAEEDLKNEIIEENTTMTSTFQANAQENI